MIQNLINKDLIFTNLSSSSKEDLLKLMGSKLEKLNFVKKGFTESVIKREEMYPTGLHGLNFGFAIPHTDSSFIIKPTIAIAIIPDGVNFKRMDDSDKSIKSKIIIMLAINSPDTQLDALQTIVVAMQDEFLWNEIFKTNNTETIAKLIIDRFTIPCY